MEPTPLHPLFVHLPIALAVLMPLLAGGLLLAWWRDWLPKRSWAIAAGCQALLFASGLVAMRTGEADEERVERVVPEPAIEAHEEAAETFVWSSGAVALLTLLPLLLRRRQVAGLAALAAAVGTVVVLGLGYRVGQAGGELVYRHGAGAAFAAQAGGEAASARAQRRVSDDDDR
jgi:uncharacterized membrane protein